MEDLKDCPFCGEYAIFKTESNSDYEFNETIKVCCSFCWATGPEFKEWEYIHPSNKKEDGRCGYLSIKEHAINEAIKSWNKRKKIK